MTLSSLTAWDWFCIFTAWGLLALVAAFALGRGVKLADDTERASYPPPVPPSVTPPFSQTVPSVDWFYDIPADCLSDDAIRALSDDIAANFRVIGGAA